jgi:hypothetical protein
MKKNLIFLMPPKQIPNKMVIEKRVSKENKFINLYNQSESLTEVFYDDYYYLRSFFIYKLI